MKSLMIMTAMLISLNALACGGKGKEKEEEKEKDERVSLLR